MLNNFLYTKLNDVQNKSLLTRQCQASPTILMNTIVTTGAKIYSVKCQRFVSDFFMCFIFFLWRLIYVDLTDAAVTLFLSSALTSISVSFLLSFFMWHKKNSIEHAIHGFRVFFFVLLNLWLFISNFNWVIYETFFYIHFSHPHKEFLFLFL